MSLASVVQTLYRSFPCQARKTRSRRCSSSSQKVCQLFGSPCGHRTVISHSDYYSIFKVQLRRSFTYSHWERANGNPKREKYFEFEKPSHLFPLGRAKLSGAFENFLFCKEPLHSFGQRVPKCTPIFEVF